MPSISLILLAAAAAPYFPPEYGTLTVECPGAPKPLALISEGKRDWFSSHLKAAGEPSLYAGHKFRGEELRFTWLRSFDQPMTVRVSWRRAGPAILTARLLSGAGGYEPGGVQHRVDRQLTAAERRSLAKLLRSARNFPRPSLCDLGLDGAEWILEYAGDHGYSYAAHWSPDSGAVHDIGLALLRLTGWNLEPIY